jgi:hypothetical protein
MAKATKKLPAARARIFDQASKRQRKRQNDHTVVPASDRGWTREDLYDRSRAR